jgi:hypothetical protein
VPAQALTSSDEAPVRLVLRARPGLKREKRQQLTRGGGRLRREIAAIDTEVIEVARESADQIAGALRATGGFAFVEIDQVASATATANDPYFSEQWGAQRINVADAWDTTQGGAVVVAVLDTGVDGSHPDLAGQLLPGWDFVNDDGDASDDNGHGTAMAGIIGAAANNGIGVAGVAPAGAMLPVKVLDETAWGYHSDIAAGIIYAVDHGARVINLSLGGPSGSATFQAAVDYARANDVVVVGAAGNDGSTTPSYPAANEGAVAVSAIDSSDGRAWFSNYGSWITLAAPGINLHTALYGGDYIAVTGTSGAAAIASGAFALLRSAYPGMTAQAAIDAMTASADDLGSSGWDAEFGFGLIDAHAALLPPAAADDRSDPVVALVSPQKSNLVDGLASVEVGATDNVGVTRVDLHVDGYLYATTNVGPYLFAWDTAGLNPGVHSLRAYAYDGAGNSARTGVVKVYVTPGEGLLVQRAKVKSGTGDADGSIALRGMLRLPQGFDAGSDSVSITLYGGADVVMAMQVAAGTMETNRSTATYRGLAQSPAGGDVRVVIKPNRVGGTYSLQVSGRDMNLSNATTPMQLSLDVGGQLLSQALTLRTSRGSLVIP